ncbi:MAG TPA: SurA N-terminal domain-containing protein [Blastocatellia bacterium]|nr:SurA N-terminal domain-containing protein [Blastocatellia bacterium]
MKFVVTTLALAFVLALATTARAQEPELVNEIVARVNNDIITRTDYLAALDAFKEELKRQMQGKSDAEITAEFEKLKPTVLDMMVEDLLLEQKAKELGIDVEADVNQQMLQIAKDSGFKTLSELEQAMRNQGVDPENARTSLRRRLQQQYVVQREVLVPIYQRLSEKDKRDFYEKNKDKLTVPGEMTLSEIFIPLEGHTAAEVEQRARRVVAELRAGASFSEAVKTNTPATRASRSQDGKLGTFTPTELKEEIAAAVSSLKAGEVTEPIRLQDGFQILRVDTRKDATVRPLEDKEVQEMVARAATMERAEDARKKYLKKLREEAFVEIAKGYQAAQAKVEKE